MRGGYPVGAVLALVAALLPATAAQASLGAFERAWGEDVVSAGPGNFGAGIERCVAANGDVCKDGIVGGLGGAFDSPEGVATDSAGNVYVADGGNFRIQKFSASGVFERAWGKDVVNLGPGNTGTGFEVCVAANGDVCQSGATGSLGGEFSYAYAVAADSLGNVYVADPTSSRIQKFSSAGAFERAWGEDVASAGPGNTGTGFEVCVAANGDVCKAGAPTAPALGGELNNPYGIGTDASGFVYVADRIHSRIQKFTSSGGFVRAWGEDVVSAGPGNTGTGFEVCVAANGDTCKTGIETGADLGGELGIPAGVATDGVGNVYVGDLNQSRVQSYSLLGAFERAWGEDVASAGPGNTGTGFEVCVAANGDTCKTGVSVASALGGDLSSPSGVAADGAGDVYVSDYSFDRVQKFSSAGAFERAWGKDVASSGPGNTGTGFEVCVAANGDVCQEAALSIPPALGGELNVPRGVAADTAGNVYVADSGNDRIQKFDPLTVPPTVPPAATPAAGPTGRRAAALKKCKKKKKRARKQCRKKANKKPL